MYKRKLRGWAKHLDFLIVDLICLQLALFLAYYMRHGILLCLYWHPFYWIFSLFKQPHNYDYRYSFLVEFFILFLAAYNCAYAKEKKNIVMTGAVAIVFSILNIVLTRHYTHQEKIYACLTVAMIIVLTALYISSQLMTKQKNKTVTSCSITYCRIY